MILNVEDEAFIGNGAPTLEAWLDRCAELWDCDFGWFNYYETNAGRCVFKFKVGRSVRNRDIYEAMKRNTLMWGVGWYSSNRKGIHKFKFRTPKAKDNVVQFPKPPISDLLESAAYFQGKSLDTAAVM